MVLLTLKFEANPTTVASGMEGLRGGSLNPNLLLGAVFSPLCTNYPPASRIMVCSPCCFQTHPCAPLFANKSKGLRCFNVSLAASLVTAGNRCRGQSARLKAGWVEVAVSGASVGEGSETTEGLSNRLEMVIKA